MGRECKRYLQRVHGRKREAVAKQPCSYEDCGSSKVWYWSWYRRKGGCVPLEGSEDAAGPLWIRRFYCTICRRTFSWRPWFLVFGHSFVTVAYQYLIKTWCLGAGHPRWLRQASWWQPGAAADKALCRTLLRRSRELIHRLRTGLERYSGRGRPVRCVPSADPRRAIWHLSRELARSRKSPERRMSCHYLFMCLAHTRNGAIYSLESC